MTKPTEPAEPDEAEGLATDVEPTAADDASVADDDNPVVATEDEPAATAHGSLHDYDRQVPLLVLPPGRTTHAPAEHAANMVDMRSVAPLLAGWLGVNL